MSIFAYEVKQARQEALERRIALMQSGKPPIYPKVFPQKEIYGFKLEWLTCVPRCELMTEYGSHDEMWGKSKRSYAVLPYQSFSCADWFDNEGNKINEEDIKPGMDVWLITFGVPSENCYQVFWNGGTSWSHYGTWHNELKKKLEKFPHNKRYFNHEMIYRFAGKKSKTIKIKDFKNISK